MPSKHFDLKPQQEVEAAWRIKRDAVRAEYRRSDNADLRLACRLAEQGFGIGRIIAETGVAHVVASMLVLGHGSSVSRPATRDRVEAS